MLSFVQNRQVCQSVNMVPQGTQHLIACGGAEVCSVHVAPARYAGSAYQPESRALQNKAPGGGVDSRQMPAVVCSPVPRRRQVRLLDVVLWQWRLPANLSKEARVSSCRMPLRRLEQGRIDNAVRWTSMTLASMFQSTTALLLRFDIRFERDQVAVYGTGCSWPGAHRRGWYLGSGVISVAQADVRWLGVSSSTRARAMLSSASAPSSTQRAIITHQHQIAEGTR